MDGAVEFAQGKEALIADGRKDVSGEIREYSMLYLR